MAAYVIVDVEILDESLHREFRERVTPTVEAHGGRFVVRGGQIDVVVGDWSPTRLAIVKFDDFERARIWLKSPEFTALEDLLSRSSNVNMVLVDGA